VLDAGGRVYLGKDSFLDAPTFRAMYPEMDRWLEIKAKYDPDGVFTSDLSRRVGLSSGDSVRMHAGAALATADRHEASVESVGVASGGE